MQDGTVNAWACLAGLAEQAAGGEPLYAMSLFTELRTLLGRQDSSAFDGGDFCHFGRAYLPARRPLGWSYFSTFGMLDTGRPTALAMKLARTATNVVAASGDGGFGFNGFDLDTAVRHGIDVVVVLGNDAAWGIEIQIGVYGRPVVTDLLPTRYDVVACGLGALRFNVHRRSELRPALQAAPVAGRPALVHVAVSRSGSPPSAAAVQRWRAASRLGAECRRASRRGRSSTV